MKTNRREICCDTCRRVVAILTSGSKWRRGTIAICADCQEQHNNDNFDGLVSGKSEVVDELRKIFGMG